MKFNLIFISVYNSISLLETNTSFLFKLELGITIYKMSSAKNTDSKCESNGYSKKSENPYETGFFRKAIPVMPKPLAIICCLLNIIFPGLGKPIN